MKQSAPIPNVVAAARNPSTTAVVISSPPLTRERTQDRSQD